VVSRRKQIENGSLFSVRQAAAVFKIVDKLAKDPSWNALTTRRHEDFHRWRPQGISGGVAPEDPWEYRPGFASLTGYAQSQYKPLNPSTLVTEAQEGLEALGNAMGEWMGAWPSALTGLGCPIFKVNE
jgi:hypothetical protein